MLPGLLPCCRSVDHGIGPLRMVLMVIGPQVDPILFFVKASALPGDLNFDSFAFCSVTRGGFPKGFASKLTAWLEPCRGTLLLCKAASSEFVLSAHSAPSGCAFVTAAVPKEGLDWCGAIMMGVTMVGDFSSETFTYDEVLVRQLAGCAVLGLVAPSSRSESVMSRRMLYRFINSNTGGRSEMEVVKACPSSWGRGIFECTICKMSVCKKGAPDWPTGEESTPVYKSLVIAVESGARQPTLLPL